MSDPFKLPSEREAAFAFAKFLHAQRNYSAALTAWTEYVQTFGPTDPVLLNLAICHLNAGDPAESVPICEAILDRRPGWAPARHILANALAATDQLDRAYAEIQRAVRDGDSLQTRMGLAEILSAQGAQAEAKEEYERALRMTKNEAQHAGAALQLAMLLLTEEDFETAERLLDPVARGRTLDATEAVFQLGRSLYLRWFRGDKTEGLLDDARATFQLAVEANASEPRHWTGLGLCDRALGNAGAAIVEFERGIALGDDVGFVSAQLSWALYDDGQFEESVVAARTALASSVELEMAWDFLALSAVQIGVDSTGELIREAYDAAPHSQVVANVRGALLEFEATADEAAAHWTAIADQWPDDDVILKNALRSALDRADVEQCAVLVDRLESVSPGLTANLGATVIKAIESRNATSLVEVLAREDPLWPPPDEHDSSDVLNTTHIGDFLVAVQSTRFEEQIGEFLRRKGLEPEIAVRPDFLGGLEIDVLLGRHTNQVSLGEAKLRLNPAKLVSRPEVVTLQRKVERARESLGTGVQVVGNLMSNASGVDDDAREYADQHGVELQYARIPGNWGHHARWTVLEISPYP